MATAVLASGALACELPAGQPLESARFRATYRTDPSPVAVGRQFKLLLAVCPKSAGDAPGVAALRLDAHMPEHRHGMNYRPSVAQAAPGRYASEGWLFHMPGRWEFVFDIAGDRLSHSVRIE